MDGEKYKSMMGEGGGVVGMRCGEGQGWWCVLLIGAAVVRLMSCNAPLNASRLLCGKYIRWKSVPLGNRSCICSSCGKLIFVCICVGDWILFGCVRA